MSILTAIIIVLIIIIAFFGIAYHFSKHGNLPKEFFRDSIENMKLSLNHKKDEWFTKPEELYEHTVGHDNDDTAKLALKKALKKNDMYVQNERAGRASKKARQEATVTAFNIGNLYRYNVAPNLPIEAQGAAIGEAFQFYNRAINQIQENPDIVVAPIHADFMIDRIEDFYEDFLARAYRPDFQTIRENTSITRINNQNREEYFSPKPIINDPQNVHESAVVDSIKNRYDKIKELNAAEGLTTANSKQIINDIKHEISMATDEDKKRRAYDILERMDNDNSVISSLGNDSERAIIINIWNRVKSKDNKIGANALKESFIDALASGMEKKPNGFYTQVCTQGRVHRILDSLTLMDINPEISKPPKTKEMYTNEIMEKAYVILQDELKKVPKDVSKAYNGEIEGDLKLIEAVDDFKKNTCDILERKIKLDYPDAPEKMLDDIIKSAKVGI